MTARKMKKRLMTTRKMILFRKKDPMTARKMKKNSMTARSLLSNNPPLKTSYLRYVFSQLPKQWQNHH